jgi:hypothetical protein
VIRRFWRWFIDDDPDLPLRESAALLATEVHKMSLEQQADLFNRYGQLWWQVNRVAACVDMRERG